MFDTDVQNTRYVKITKLISTETVSRLLTLTCIYLLLNACGSDSSESVDPSSSMDNIIVSDTTPPIISLNGLVNVIITQGTAYSEAGATATDDIDGDISANLLITTDLDIGTVGDYQIFYNVSDSTGNPAIEVIREVVVIAPQSQLTFYAAKDFITIGSGSGGFDGVLDSGDRFGRDHAPIGDVNGDGIDDFLVGARSDDDGEVDAGAVYVLMMNEQGTINDYQKISMLEGNFLETLLPANFFGYGVAGIGDINGDDVPDIAVTAPTLANQALYILHLNRDGTVKDWNKIEGIFGQGLSAIGDIDGDGIIDLIAANPQSDDGGTDRGAIHILFLNQDSTLNRTVNISSTQGGFGEGLSDGDQFGGRESAMLGDINGDGTIELAVGAFMSDEGRGAIWILSLDNQNFNVVSKLKIGSNQGGFDEELPDTINNNGSFGGQFGHALAYAGDLNGDGIGDLVTAANQYSEGYGYILYLNADKSVKTFNRINNGSGGFELILELTERFGRSISLPIESNGSNDITINMGGGAGTTGSIFALQYQACDIALVEGNHYWQSDDTFFSNWNHTNQFVNDTLSLEQCLQKSVEFKSNKITFNPTDSRCIIHPTDAELNESSEASLSYINHCYD